MIHVYRLILHRESIIETLITIQGHLNGTGHIEYYYEVLLSVHVGVYNVINLDVLLDPQF